jgi:hypothetical protein
MTPFRINDKNLNYLSIIFIAFPPVVYFFCIFQYAVNIPFWDDFDLLWETILIVQADTFLQKIDILFSQHNEHRMAFPRLVLQFIYFIFGEVDFKATQVVGNTPMLLMGILFFKLLPPSPKKLVLFIPITLLLYDLQNWKNMTWTIGVLSNYFVLCFAGYSLFFIKEKSNFKLFAAFSLAVFATYTQGSGIGVLLIGFLYFIFFKKRRKSIIWFTGSLIILVCYFLSYEKPPYHPSILDSILHPGRLLVYFFSLTGSVVSFGNHTVSFIIGLAFLLYFLELTRRKYYLKNVPVYLFMTYIFMVTAMAAITRSPMGIEQAFSARYTIISTILLILVYISIAELFFQKENKRTFSVYITIGLALSIYAGTFKEGFDKLSSHRESIIDGFKIWSQDGKTPYIPERTGNYFITEALSRGYYKLPLQILNIDSKKISEQEHSSNNCSTKKLKSSKNHLKALVLEGTSTKPSLIRIEGAIEGYKIENAQDNSPILISFTSLNERIYFRSRLVSHLSNSQSLQNDNTKFFFISLIPLTSLNDSIYRIGFCDRNFEKSYETFITKKDGKATILYSGLKPT